MAFDLTEEKKDMNSEDFKELVKDSEDYLKVSKKKGVKLNEILVNRYTQESHFIYELLQNADDEGAKRVTFKLFENKLEFFHNGEDFNIKDIKSITSAGDSSKEQNTENEIPIGEFGIGFKSVFAITKSPEIYSGKFSIRIEDLFLPVSLEHIDRIESTKIVFPFNHDIKTANQCFNIVKEGIDKKGGLDNIGAKTLLFLRNIEEIEIETPESKGFYKRDIKVEEKIKKVNISFSIKNNIKEEQYIIFEKPVSYIEDTKKRNLKVEIAFRMNKQGKIIPSEYSKLIVFFHTDKDTYLNFLIQGPYSTNPSRDTIIDNKKNKLLIEESANLVAGSIKIIRDLGFLDVDFLSLLPISPSHKPYYKGEIYETIYNKVKELFLSDESLLPTTNGALATIKNCILAGGKDLTNLLQKEQIKKLYGVEYWLSNDITPTFKEYLIDGLGFKEIDFKNFANKLTENFLIEQLKDWIIEFYSILNKDHHALWDRENSILRNKPIIRLENGKHSCPFDSQNEPLVYLPNANSSKFPTVESIICQNEEAKSFLEKLGIKTPDILAEIKEHILPRYKKENNNINSEYFQDFGTILGYFEEDSCSDKFIKELKNFYFILCYDNKTGKKSLRKAEECYLPTDDLKVYFSNQSVYFVDIKEYSSFTIDNFFKDELKIRISPKIIEIYDIQILTEEEKKVYRNGRTWKNDLSIETKDLEGLKYFLSNITNKDSEYSITLWKIILNLNNFSYFDGKYSWDSGNRTPTPERIDSQILKYLKESKWLLKNDYANSFYKPKEIRLSELHDVYKSFNNNNEYFKAHFIEKLDFKPEKIEISKDNLSDEIREHVEELEAKLSLYKEYEELTKDYDINDIRRALEMLKPKLNLFSSDNKNNIFTDKSIDNSKNEDDDNDRLPTFESDSSTEEDASIIFEEDSYYDSEEIEKNINNGKLFDNKGNFESKDFNYENKSTKPPKTQSERIEADLNKHKNKIVSEEEKIEFLEKIKELEESIKSLTKYSFKWFTELLELEYLLSEQKSSNKKEFSITFSKVEKLSGSFIVLRNPDKFIPNSIEDLGDITLTLKTKSGKKTEITIDVVQIKDNSVKVKLKSEKSSNEFNFNEVISAEINISNLLFILEELKEKFKELPFLDDDNLKELLPDSLEFVFGPPGTGKTTHISKELISIMKENKKVLVLTPTNKAADVTVKKIISENNNQVPDWLIRFGSTSDNEIESLGIVKDKDFDIDKMNKNVVITTIARFPYNKIGEHELRDYNWDIVVFDEASMISIAGIVYTIFKKEKSERLIVAGDPFQIPPIVHAEEWKDENIYTLVELNNFENTTTTPKDFKVHRLMKQYRSIESIGKLFSNYTYNGLLEHNRTDNDKKELIIKNNSTKAINFIEFPVNEQRLKKIYTLNKSPYQIYSALLSFEFALQLKEEIEEQWGIKNLNSHTISLEKNDEFDMEKLNKEKWTIGVVCPYKAQAIIIDRLINSLPNDKSKVSIISGSVHGFQGDECDIIITVLNPPQSKGANVFLNNQRILNVAISRAKNYLFIMIPENGRRDFPEIGKIFNATFDSISDNFSSEKSINIEKLLFDNQKFIEENTFVTSHQKVNVYSNPVYKYEVRNRDASVDGDAIDIHLKI